MPVSFEDIESNFRQALLGSYNQDWTTSAFGANFAVSASARGPSYFSSTFDLPRKNLFATLQGTMTSQGVSLRDSAIGFRCCANQTVALGTAGKLKYTYNDETFTAAATTDLLDGFPTDASIATDLCKGAHVGAAVSYDPSRSGLKNYTFTLVADRVKELRNAAVLLKLDATEGYAVGVTLPVRDQLAATTLLSRREFKVGARMLSPCGHAAVAGFVDAFNRTLALTATKTYGAGWKMSLSATLRAEEPLAPAFGVSFVAE